MVSYKGIYIKERREHHVQQNLKRIVALILAGIILLGSVAGVVLMLF